MSFSKNLNQVIFKFIDAVAIKYNLDGDDLKKLWDGSSAEQQPKSVSSPTPSVDSSASTPASTPASTLPNSSELGKLKNSELQAHCKARGLKTTGTKQELIDRLLGGNIPGAAAPSKKKETTPSVAATPVPKLAQTSIQTVQIKKNSFGNFEHSESGLIFDKVTQKVIGKQNKDGTVKPLTDEDIETCNKYKFKYVIPENLNANTKTNVAIEGLEEEEETSTTDVINEAEDVLAAEEEEEEEEEEELAEEEEIFEDDE